MCSSLPLLCNIAQPWTNRSPNGMNGDLNLGFYLPSAALRSFTIRLLGKTLYHSIMHKKHSVVFTLMSIKPFHSGRLIASQRCEVVYTFWNPLFRHPGFPEAAGESSILKYWDHCSGSLLTCNWTDRKVEALQCSPVKVGWELCCQILDIYCFGSIMDSNHASRLPFSLQQHGIHLY